jgi:hypothetical protein
LHDMRGVLTLSQEPEDLPLAARRRIGGLTLPQFQLVKLQMWSERSSSQSPSPHPDLVSLIAAVMSVVLICGSNLLLDVDICLWPRNHPEPELSSATLFPWPG